MTRKRKDLTGQRFGSLTVLHDGPPHVFPRGVSERTWVCKCDCGREATYRTSLLTGGLATSCGCQSVLGRPIGRHEGDLRNAPVDLTGKTFGVFTVLGPAAESDPQAGKYLWRAQCSLCGGIKVYDSATMHKAARYQSCGCQKNALVQKICSRCGQSYMGTQRSKYCPDCKKKSREDSAKKSMKKLREKRRTTPIDKENDPVILALENAAAITAQQAERETHKGLVLRRCKKCGTDYWTKPGDSYLCPACAEKSRREGVLGNRTCADCGVTFLGYPRSKRCPACQREARKEAYRRSKERKKAGTTRPIGSTDICQNCGQPYTVTSGLQRYCPDCAKTVVAENVRQHKRDYMAENRDHFDALKKEYRSGRRVCVICGKTFDSPTCTTVCSADCAAEQLRRTRVRAQVNAGRAKPVRLLGPRGAVNPQSGIPGIHYHPKTGKWELVINDQYCGLYDTVAAANEEREKILKEDKDEKSD